MEIQMPMDATEPMIMDGVNKAKRDAPPGEGSYDSTITSFEAELAATEIEICAVDETLACTAPIWSRLEGLLPPLVEDEEEDGRIEAGRKLVMNHEAVLRDITNPCPSTQLQLVRVQEANAHFVDQLLRELARRLLRRQPGGKAIQKERLDLNLKDQAAVWAKAAKYLEARIQSYPGEKPGREPDLSPGAAAAMRAVLQEMWWVAFSAAKAAATPKGGRRSSSSPFC